MRGGPGYDLANYTDAETPQNIKLETAGAVMPVDGSDLLVSIEAARGTDFNDTISGNEYRNYLYGHDGNDDMHGGMNADRLFGDLGDDDLRGGGGSDTIFGGGGSDFLVGGGGADIFEGPKTNNVLYGGAGNDLLSGGAGADTIGGGDGFDTVDYSDAMAGVLVSFFAGRGGIPRERDRLFSIEAVNGSDFDDCLAGNAQGNSFEAKVGSDSIFGYAGSDTLSGGEGSDRLNGGFGNDVLIGGGGPDEFVYFAGHGVDTIKDFTLGEDQLVITGSAYTFDLNDRHASLIFDEGGRIVFEEVSNLAALEEDILIS